MTKILFIDAGHGGVDSAGNYTTPPKNGKWFDHKKGIFHKGSIFLEGVWNRAFAKAFILKATEAGFQCKPVMHPENDTRLGERVELANQMFTQFGQGIYLSFHSNAANSKARGFNLFYHPNSKKGKDIAQAIVLPIQNTFIKHGSKSPQPLRQGYMNAEKTAIFYVLEATKSPALLFEFGFFDNYEDATLLMKQEFIDELAGVVVNSLKSYLNV
jgi:N-acetylmuramoyl-L-alanine amidase